MVEWKLPKLHTRVRFPSLAYTSMARFISILIGLGLLSLSGCTTVPVTPTVAVTPTTPSQPGIYHKVRKGQTIWRIAKAYNISVDEIIHSNSIPNIAKIEENQLIFIPGATSVKEIKPDTIDSNDFVWPVKGHIVQYFRENKNGEPTNGIRIRVDEGEKVRASRGGEVILADYLTGYGYTVIIDHHDNYYTVYGENGKLLVKLGDQVAQNNEIAYVGKDKGESFTYFEIRKNAKEDNPMYYLP